jgi:hypothetical protein
VLKTTTHPPPHDQSEDDEEFIMKDIENNCPFHYKKGHDLTTCKTFARKTSSARKNGSNEADFVADAFLLVIKQVSVSWSLSAINVKASGTRENYMWRRKKKTKAKARRRLPRRSHLNVHQFANKN